jgi:hypothetical protein
MPEGTPARREGTQTMPTATARKRIEVVTAQVATRTLIEAVRPGSRVTIITYHGSRLTGRAVMRSSLPGAWVLNMGGRHGTPGIATADNTVAVRGGRR